MFVGDLVRVSRIIEDSNTRARRYDARGIVIALSSAWPDDRYEEMLTVTVQFADGFADQWYDWQLEVLSSTAE